MMEGQQHICHANYYGGFGTLTEPPAEYYRGYCDSHLKICGGRMVEFNVKLPSGSISDWEHTCNCDKEQIAMGKWCQEKGWPDKCNNLGGQMKWNPNGNRGQIKWNPYGYRGQIKWNPYEYRGHMNWNPYG